MNRSTIANKMRVLVAVAKNMDKNVMKVEYKDTVATS